MQPAEHDLAVPVSCRIEACICLCSRGLQASCLGSQQQCTDVVLLCQSGITIWLYNPGAIPQRPAPLLLQAEQQK